jgi:hypothetical protein
VPNKRKIAGRKSAWWLDAPMIEQVNTLAIARGCRPNKIVSEALTSYLERPPAEPVLSARSLMSTVKFPPMWR